MKLKHRGNCILFTFHPNRSDAFGYFDEDNGKIYINTCLSLLMRECVYFHELTHQECFRKKCKCWSKTHWCEYHALRGELRKVIDAGSVRLRKAYLKNVEKVIRKYKQDLSVWGCHFTAIKRLMRTRAFKEIEKG